MKTVFATLAAAVALTAGAAPAAAQSHRADAPRYEQNRVQNINQHQRELDRKINVGARRGTLPARKPRKCVGSSRSWCVSRTATAPTD